MILDIYIYIMCISIFKCTYITCTWESSSSFLYFVKLSFFWNGVFISFTPRGRCLHGSHGVNDAVRDLRLHHRSLMNFWSKQQGPSNFGAKSIDFDLNTWTLKMESFPYCSVSLRTKYNVLSEDRPLWLRHFIGLRVWSPEVLVIYFSLEKFSIVLIASGKWRWCTGTIPFLGIHLKFSFPASSPARGPCQWSAPLSSSTPALRQLGGLRSMTHVAHQPGLLPGNPWLSLDETAYISAYML